jgi:hypothetical protein
MRFLPLVAIFLLHACDMDPILSDSPVIARVGTVELTLSEAKTVIPDHIFADDSLRALDHYVREWVKTQVWVQDAERRGILNSTESKQRLRHSRNETIQQLAREVFLQNEDITVSDAEVEAFFQENRDQFVLDEGRVRLVHIRCEDLNTALQAKAELRNSGNYRNVIAKYAINKEQTMAEAEQFFPLHTALADYDVLRPYLLDSKMKEKEISPIRRIGDQLHFFQLLERRKEGDVAKVDWVKSSIREWLLVEKRKKRLNAYEQNLILQANANGEITKMLTGQR